MILGPRVAKHLGWLADSARRQRRFCFRVADAQAERLRRQLHAAGWEVTQAHLTEADDTEAA
jgi:hypothetical protein